MYMANTGPIMKGMVKSNRHFTVSGDNNDVDDIFKMLVSTSIFRERERAEIDRPSRWVNKN